MAESGNPFKTVASGDPLRIQAAAWNKLLSSLNEPKGSATPKPGSAPAIRLMRLGSATATPPLFAGRLQGGHTVAIESGSTDWVERDDFGHPRDDQEILAVALNAMPSVYPAVELGRIGGIPLMGFLHVPKRFRVVSSTSAGTNQWAYTLIEQRRTGAGVTDFEDHPDADNVTGVNINEDGVLPDGISSLNAVPNDAQVIAIPMPYSSGVVWEFDRTNDGVCE